MCTSVSGEWLRKGFTGTNEVEMLQVKRYIFPGILRFMSSFLLCVLKCSLQVQSEVGYKSIYFSFISPSSNNKTFNANIFKIQLSNIHFYAMSLHKTITCATIFASFERKEQDFYISLMYCQPLTFVIIYSLQQ